MMEWSMANHAADMQRVMDEADVFLESRPVSAKRKYAVRLALDELLSNVIKYAYDDEGAHQIAVRLELDDPATLTIEDDGRAFDPLADAPAPVLAGPVEDRPIGGLGLHILQAMGLKLNYRRENNHNLLRIVFPAE